MHHYCCCNHQQQQQNTTCDHIHSTQQHQQIQEDHKNSLSHSRPSSINTSSSARLPASRGPQTGPRQSLRTWAARTTSASDHADASCRPPRLGQVSEACPACWQAPATRSPASRGLTGSTGAPRAPRSCAQCRSCQRRLDKEKEKGGVRLLI